MVRLFKAFLFRIKRDLTFRITLFIGIGLAILISLAYFSIEKILFSSEDNVRLISGESMFIQSLSPVSNFGIAIPVNLISFTVLEFTQGTIRNKIIAGNSKFKIYTSLLLSGLVFSIVLILVYATLSLALGCLLGGGYRIDNVISIGMGGMAKLTTEYTIRLIVVTLFTYISVSSFAVFIACLTRQIGGSIPIVIIALLFLYLVATILSGIAYTSEEQVEKYKSIIWVLRIIDPLYSMASSEYVFKATSSGTEMYKIMEDETFVCGIINNLVYTLIFYLCGALIFNERDVK